MLSDARLDTSIQSGGMCHGLSERGGDIVRMEIY